MDKQTGHVLVVDDEKEVCEVLARELSGAGFTTVTACSGKEALEKFSTVNGFITAIVDLVMPEMDGLELARRIHSVDSDLPVIILTARASLDTARAGYDCGVYRYFVKPEGLEQIVETVIQAAELYDLRRRDRITKKQLEQEIEKRTSELEQQKSAIQTQHQRISSIIEGASFGLVVINNEDNVFLVNRQAEKLLDMATEYRGHADNRPYREVFPTSSAELITRLTNSVRETNQPQSISGVSISAATVLNLESYPVVEDEKIEAVVIVVNDVTEKKHLELQLVQAQKLESIGQLAAGIAHEINTPTQFVGDNIAFLGTAFSWLIDLMAEYDKLCAEIKTASWATDQLEAIDTAKEKYKIAYLIKEIPKAVEQAKEGVGRISKIVGAMKEFAHPGTEEKVLIDLNRAIENTVNVSRNEWKYVADMEMDLDPSLPQVPCHPGAINQVFLNMIINASHAIGDVVDSGKTEKGVITIRTREDNGRVVVEIADTGSGIPEEIRSRIFDPFFTTKEVGRGTGQGLAISRSVIVDKHGGTISVESEVGKGTTFVIKLPLEPTESAPRDENEPTE